MVVYANEQQQRRGSSSRTSAVEDGAIMIERQTMIRLPDLSHMQVKCTVHESKIDSLKRGMRARIRIQDHEYQGIVTSVANQPEPGDWFSGNVREYATVVSIESDPHGLRPGLTAAVEILVANVPNVLSVPVQAVVEKRGKFYCWINDGGVPKRRDVVLGVSNNTRIEIKDGVAEGDEVLLNPRAAVDEASEDEHTEENVDVKQRFGGDKPASLPPPSGGAPAVAGNGPPKLDIASLDKDGDKKISKEEAPERMKEFFDKLDSNSDGFIDAKELAALRSRRGGGPGGPEGGPGGPPGARARPLEALGAVRQARPEAVERDCCAGSRLLKRRPLVNRFHVAARPSALERPARQLETANEGRTIAWAHDSGKRCGWGSKACCCTSCAPAWPCWASSSA